VPSIKAQHQKSRRIIAKEVAVPPHMSFCFKYLEESHDDFALCDCSEGWLRNLIERLKAYSGKTVDEIINSRSKSIRCHSHDFSTLGREPFSCYRDPQLRQIPPQQLSLGMNSGRIHGFFLHEKFFIVWLDHSHNLYGG